jgi:hypothetical protein
MIPFAFPIFKDTHPRSRHYHQQANRSAVVHFAVTLLMGLAIKNGASQHAGFRVAVRLKERYQGLRTGLWAWLRQYEGSNRVVLTLLGSCLSLWV